MAMMNEALYVICSREHRAWWCPGHRGYTKHLVEAGLYTRPEATEIVRAANIVKFEECLVPVTAIIPMEALRP